MPLFVADFDCKFQKLAALYRGIEARSHCPSFPFCTVPLLFLLLSNLPNSKLNPNLSSDLDPDFNAGSS